MTIAASAASKAQDFTLTSKVRNARLRARRKWRRYSLSESKKTNSICVSGLLLDIRTEME